PPRSSARWPTRCTCTRKSLPATTRKPTPPNRRGPTRPGPRPATRPGRAVPVTGPEPSCDLPPMTYDPYRRHPWHGLPVGKQAPRLVHAFIEITPFDLVKYELDKENGYLRVDRPQRTS